MKRAISVSSDRTELVPNYWLRSLESSQVLDTACFQQALREAGIAADVLQEPGLKLPLAQEIAVVECLARQNADPLFPLRLGLTSQAHTGSVLSYLLFASPTLEVGLRRMCEFARLTRPRSRVELILAEESAEFRLSHPEPLVQRAFTYREFVLGNILHSFAVATQGALKPDGVYIAVPIGARAQRIAAVLGCRVEDAKGYSAIVMKPSALDLPIRSSDAHLLQHLTEYGRLLLDRQRPEPTTTRERVFRFLLREVPMGVPRMAQAAEALALSERTLARRLAEEGTTFREVVDETRATMAEALLDDPSVSVTEISYLLSFSDPGSFSHAYRRWRGHAPISARRRRAPA